MRAAKGQQCFVIDPFGGAIGVPEEMKRSFNPLEVLEDPLSDLKIRLFVENVRERHPERPVTRRGFLFGDQYQIQGMPRKQGDPPQTRLASGRRSAADG
jgi:hypothetical protein